VKSQSSGAATLAAARRRSSTVSSTGPARSPTSFRAVATSARWVAEVRGSSSTEAIAEAPAAERRNRTSAGVNS
jgi:hypothetical protein